MAHVCSVCEQPFDAMQQIVQLLMQLMYFILGPRQEAETMTGPSTTQDIFTATSRKLAPDVYHLCFIWQHPQGCRLQETIH